jgi:hypothetical protein
MAPPATVLSTVRHQVSLYRHYAFSWVVQVTSGQQNFQLLGRLVIFLAKMLMVTKPCLPAMPKETIWYPLMSLAALELALWPKIGWRLVLMLLFVHLMVLGLAFNFGGGMCPHKGLQGEWSWND